VKDGAFISSITMEDKRRDLEILYFEIGKNIPMLEP
jgi:hypothetical protein